MRDNPGDLNTRLPHPPAVDLNILPLTSPPPNIFSTPNPTPPYSAANPIDFSTLRPANLAILSAARPNDAAIYPLAKFFSRASCCKDRIALNALYFDFRSPLRRPFL